VSKKKEYIERGALLKAFGCENAVKYGNKSAEQQHNSYSSMMLYEIADEINDSPAADVEPVVRGEWKDVYMSSASSFVGTCSVCHQSNDIPPPRNAHYCPNCGAHMERSGSDE